MTRDRIPERFTDGDLVVRRWLPSDAPALHAAIIRSTDHLRPWMPWIALEPQTLAQRCELIDRWQAEWRDGGDLVCGAFLAGPDRSEPGSDDPDAGDTVVGAGGLHRRLGPDGLEIGYWVHADHIRRGVATRVARLLTAGAFSMPDITHVEIHCDQANAASARVAERLHFSYVGDVTREISVPTGAGIHRVYRMRRAEWPDFRPDHG